MKKIKRGNIFYLYQDGKDIRLVVALNERQLMCLDGCAGEIITAFDLENECEKPIIDDVYNYS